MKTKRTVRPGLPSAIRLDVLSSNDGKCVYCGDPATCVDHVIPWDVCRHHERGNLVPSCQDCNSFLSSRSFSSFDEKKSFANERVERFKRGRRWYFHDVLGLCLLMFGNDPWDVAEKCGIDRLRFDDILGGHVEIEESELRILRRVLKLPGLGLPIARFEGAR